MRRPLATLGTAAAAALVVAGPALAAFTVPAANRPEPVVWFAGATLPAPANPSCTTLSSTSIRVDWSATPLHSPDDIPASHEILRSVDGGAYSSLATVVPGTVVTHTDVSSSGVDFSYKVRAVQHAWAGASSTAVDCRIGGLVSTVATSVTAARVADPERLSLDETGRYLYIADTTNHRIRRVDLETNSIATVAGDGTTGYAVGEEGAPATSASLDAPEGVFVDGAGNLFVSDSGHHRVRYVPATTGGGYTAGMIYTIAGTGTSGYSGDGGPATLAKLDRPVGIVRDSVGNVYVADRNNHRIRTFTLGGAISTATGTGTAGFNEPCAPASACRVSSPEGLGISAGGDVYVADRANHRIRKLSGATLSTVAGNGTAGYDQDDVPATGPNGDLSSPEDVAVAANGDVLIADAGNHRIRKVAAGTITTVAGTGTTAYTGEGYPAAASTVQSPSGVAAAADGRVFVSDTAHDLVRATTTDTPARLVAVAGSGAGGFAGDGGEAASAAVVTPQNLAIDGAGNAYFADPGDHRVRAVLAASGTVATVAGTGASGSSGDGGAATAARLSAPEGVAVEADGEIYVADTANHRVRKIDAAGTITTIAGTGVACTLGNQAGPPAQCGDGGAATAAKLSSPSDVVLDDADPPNVYVSDTGTHTIRKLTWNAGAGRYDISRFAGTQLAGGNAGADGTAATSARLQSPDGMGISATGDVYVTSSTRIRRVTPAGLIYDVAGANGVANDVCDGTHSPATTYFLTVHDVAVAANGDVYVSTQQPRVCRLPAGGGNPTTYLGVANGTAGDGGRSTLAQVEQPMGVAVSAVHGMFVSHSTAAGRVRRISPPL